MGVLWPPQGGGVGLFGATMCQTFVATHRNCLLDYQSSYPKVTLSFVQVIMVLAHEPSSRV
jgi:hypothetical protein